MISFIEIGCFANIAAANRTIYFVHSILSSSPASPQKFYSPAKSEATAFDPGVELLDCSTMLKGLTS